MSHNLPRYTDSGGDATDYNSMTNAFSAHAALDDYAAPASGANSGDLASSQAAAVAGAFDQHQHRALAEAKAANAARELHQQSNFLNDTLDSDKHLLTANVVHVFSWNHSEAARAEPHASQISKAAWEKAFNNSINFDEPQYIKSIDITGHTSTAPFPIAFTMTGPRNEPVHNEFKTNGDGFTALITPGTNHTTQSVYSAKNLDLNAVRDHGSATYESEAETLTPFFDNSGRDMVLVPPDSKMGRLAKNNEEFVCDTKGSRLEPIGGGINMYVLPLSKVQTLLQSYQKEVLSQLPRAKLAESKAFVERFDRSADQNEKLSFGDSRDAPGLSRAQRDHNNNANHMVIVRARVSIVNPDVLKSRIE